MATGSGAFGLKAGFNQSGGGYYTVISTIAVANFQAYTPGTGSGGATTAGTIATYNYAADGAINTSSLLAVGNVLKDMGKTVVSSGRTFRKFQGVAAASLSTFGVTGAGPVSPAAGYVTGYLEVAREGTGVVAGNLLARAF